MPRCHHKQAATVDVARGRITAAKLRGEYRRQASRSMAKYHLFPQMPVLLEEEIQAPS